MTRLSAQDPRKQRLPFTMVKLIVMGRDVPYDWALIEEQDRRQEAARTRWAAHDRHDVLTSTREVS